MDKKKNSSLDTLIKILAIILLIALLCLTALKIYKVFFTDNNTSNTTDVIGGNQISNNDSDNEVTSGKLITTGDASAVEFYEMHYSYNESFSIYNMFPGDGFNKGYAVSINHIGPIDVNFYVDVLPGYEKLANALQVRMLYNGSVIHTGSLIDFSYTARINSNVQQKDVLDYQVEVYLPTSVTEEYANLDCFADFLWKADEVIDGNGKEGKLVTIVNTGVSGLVHKVVNNGVSGLVHEVVNDDCLFYPLLLLILLVIYLLSRRNRDEDK